MQDMQRTIGAGLYTDQVRGRASMSPPWAEEVSRAFATACQHPARCQGMRIQGSADSNRCSRRSFNRWSNPENRHWRYVSEISGESDVLGPSWDRVCRSSRELRHRRESGTESKRCVLDFLAV